LLFSLIYFCFVFDEKVMEEQKIQILQVALKLFEQQGIRRVSIDDICCELRMSKKTFYNYFPQKENLVAVALKHHMNAMHDKMDKIAKQNTAIDSVILIVKEIKKSAGKLDSPFHYDAQKYYSHLLDESQEEYCQYMNDWLVANLLQGINEGMYREDIDVELMALFHTIRGTHALEKIAEKMQKISKRRVIDFYCDMIVRLIANEKGLTYFKENYNLKEKD